MAWQNEIKNDYLSISLSKMNVCVLESVSYVTAKLLLYQPYSGGDPHPLSPIPLVSRSPYLAWIGRSKHEARELVHLTPVMQVITLAN